MCRVSVLGNHLSSRALGQTAYSSFIDLKRTTRRKSTNCLIYDSVDQ